MIRGKLLILEILSIIFVPGVMTFYLVCTSKKLIQKFNQRKKLVAIPIESCYTE